MIMAAIDRGWHFGSPLIYLEAEETMRLAVLGAGLTGVCAALELAARGREVDLYDEALEPVAKASFHNEGKIHLGLIYAKDRSLHTAARRGRSS